MSIDIFNQISLKHVNDYQLRIGRNFLGVQGFTRSQELLLFCPIGGHCQRSTCRSPGPSVDVVHRGDRRLSGRPRVPHLQGSEGKRKVVDPACLSSLHPLGDVGGSHCSEVPEPLSTAQLYNVGPFGQHDSGLLPVSGRLFEIPSPQQVDHEGMVVGDETRVAPAGGASSGSLELPGRCPLSQQTNTNRVDPGPGLVRLVVTADIHPPPKSTCALRRPTQGCRRL